MGRRIGVIAGSGEFPFLAISGLQARGDVCFVAAVEGAADAALQNQAQDFTWVKPGEISELTAFFKSNRVSGLVMAGKIDPRVIFEKDKLDRDASLLLAQAARKTPAALLRLFIDYMSGQGFEVLDLGFLLQRYFCPEGVLTRKMPSPEVLDDIDFGLSIARQIADADIGQTVVVKERAIVAVEGMEGTNEAIIRGGQLAGPGTVVVKVGRASQDMRIDVPAVGRETIQRLAEIKAAALCLEASQVAFFQKEEAVSLAEAQGIVLVARKL